MTMDQNILNGVGKKTRNSYLRGEIPASQVERMYARNKREADEFSAYGLKSKDMVLMLRECHNPVLKAKIEECIRLYDEKSRTSSLQNKTSIEKLNNFMTDALGVGLRRVISVMKNESRKSKNKELKIVTALLEAEFANLNAKTHGKKIKQTIYDRKSILLENIARMLKNSNWRYGYNDNCGKNASYLIYVYLPNGVQLTWHSNDYTTIYKFPYIEAEWDGRVCATLEKILDFISSNYSHFFEKTIKIAA